jgi:hypothetical protein
MDNGTMFIITIVSSLVLAVAILGPLYILHRRRTARMRQSLGVGETVIASGMLRHDISARSMFKKEQSASLVRAEDGSYHLLVGRQGEKHPIEGIEEAVVPSAVPNDLRTYMAIKTPSGKIYFAPFKGLFLTGQGEYAGSILYSLLAEKTVPRLPAQNAQ